MEVKKKKKKKKKLLYHSTNGLFLFLSILHTPKISEFISIFFQF